MADWHTPTVLRREPDTNVHVVCDCGNWEFEGDWDDMCHSWFEHEMDPEYTHLYVSRTNTTFLSRAGAEKLKEVMARPRQPLPADPLPLQDPPK